MKNKIGGIFIGLTSITVLVMLVSSFDANKAKYLPAFLQAQKYVLPLILTGMAVGYVIFFEPERLRHRGTQLFMQSLLVVTTGLFIYFFATLNFSPVSVGTVVVYILQILALLAVTIFFFSQPKK